MLLCELFDEGPLEVSKTIQQDLLDILTPLVARGVGEVTVPEIEQRLQAMRPGIKVTRKLVMDILDPDQVKLIQKIEGDKVVLDNGKAPDRALDKEDEQRERERMSDRAAKQAKSEIEKKATPKKAPPKPEAKQAPKDSDFEVKIGP